MVWLWLAVGVLIVVWIVWPTDSCRRLPVLLLVRNRADEVEGVLRLLLAQGRLVHVVVRDSGDESLAIVRRLAREAAAVRLYGGDIEQALAESALGAAILMRLDDDRPSGAVLREAGF